jgi:uncharacterized FlgJ-related protein
MKKLLAAPVALAFALSAVALVAAHAADHHEAEEQDVEELIELMRQDVRAQKADVIAKTMELDTDEAAAFWPVYKKYEAERKVLADDRIAIIKDYADNYETLTHEKAKELITRALDNDGDVHALEKKYLEEFLKVLPATTVARFYQVESRINNLIDLELSSQIPLAY